MRASFEYIKTPDESSWRYESGRADHFPFLWHYHREYEITLIGHGSGTRFIGDRIDPFEPDDLVLVGPSLPHTWHSSPSSNAQSHEATIIQVSKEFLTTLLAAPQFAPICRLLSDGSRGVSFDRCDTASERDLIGRMASMDACSRTVALLQLLNQLAAITSRQVLASVGFAPDLSDSVQSRIDSACRFVSENYAHPVSFDRAANLTHMTPAAFSRFFRRSTGKSFTTYVNEVRISAACRLLIETDSSITAIATDVGFQNLSNFNRRFRELTGSNPRQYRRRFLENDSP